MADTVKAPDLDLEPQLLKAGVRASDLDLKAQVIGATEAPDPDLRPHAEVNATVPVRSKRKKKRKSKL
jgi:hypothetical protein